MVASNITVQDILDQLNDLVQNYTTGTIDLGNRMRAVNRATEWVQRRLTLPSDKKIFKFVYSADNGFYTLPSDFNEPLQVLYQSANSNLPGRDWRYLPDDEILSTQGVSLLRRNWSTTTINGLWQLLMQGANLHQGQTINTFDSLLGNTASNDAFGAFIDNNVFVQGSGSLNFSINPALGNGKGSIGWTGGWNVSSQHQNDSYYKCKVFLPSTNLTSINLVMGSDALDYYTFTTSLTDSGTTWVPGTWNPISWNWASNPTLVGSPNDQAINFMRVDFVENGSFGGSTVANFRIDDFYFTVPDQMELIYLTNFKGTDTTGVTNRLFFTQNSDIPSFSSFVPDLLMPIAFRAAYLLYPQLRADLQFMQEYKNECEAVLKEWGKVYPRRRVVNYGQTVIQRP